MPAASARMYQCLPVAEHGSVLHVAMADPLTNHQAIDELAYVGKKSSLWSGMRTRSRSSFRGITGTTRERVGHPEGTGIRRGHGEEVSEAAVTEDAAGMADLANEVPIVRFVNLVLFQAVQDRASDIISSRSRTSSRSGIAWTALYEMTPPPKHLALPVISRLKVMANLNISERRLPQDGRISFQMGNRQVDLRVSTLPTQFEVAGVACAGPFGGEPRAGESWVAKYVSITLARRFSSRTEFSSSRGRPVPGKRRRFTRACGG